MSKKYHAICVGHKPGLYTEWYGENGAEAQKKCIRKYNQKTGFLSTNNLNDAIEFLRSNQIRCVKGYDFNEGTNMTFEELVQKDAFLSEKIQSIQPVSTATHQEERNHTTRPPVTVQKSDTSHVKSTDVSQQVDQFCKKYNFTHLSTEQRLAVQAIKGKYLLFAVPGSGKTTVMMARVGYMIHACGIRASQLMTMTFTKASAKEMCDRYRRYFPDETGSDMPDFRTIHSFCMGIAIPRLQRAGFTCPKHVVDENSDGILEEEKKYKKVTILAKVLKDSGIRKYYDETTQNSVQSAFSAIKNRRMSKNEYSKYQLLIDKQKYSIAELYENYQKELADLDCMDYDDMLVHTLKGLQEYPKVLRELQCTYQYWSIDEAQDNSRVQNELLELLCSESGNLFMVGDDDQSIYSFRGAEPSMLLSFGNQDGVQTLIMGTNYRSYKTIVESAKAFIEHNECRADKQMTPKHTETGILNIPQSFTNEAVQYSYIDMMAQKCRAQGKCLGVLYQLNASALPLIVHMHRLGMPFEASKGIDVLLNTKPINTLLHILYFAAHPENFKAFKCSYLDLGMGFLSKPSEQLQKLEQENKSHPDLPILNYILDDMDENDKNRAKIQKIQKVLVQAEKKSPANALKEILQGLADLLYPETLNERLYIYGLMSVCDMYATTEDLFDDLSKMKKEAMRQDASSNDEISNEELGTSVTAQKKPVVSLSTIHSAKGREWDYVILIDSIDEVFPGRPQEDRIGFDPEEARRVFYVAITRAIERLDILTVDAYHDNCEPVSSFIEQLAYEVDLISDSTIDIDNEIRQMHQVRVGTLCKLEPGKYYSVPPVLGAPNRYKPGVYTRWNDVETMKVGISIPPELQPKAHDTREEAEARVGLNYCQPLRQKLKRESIECFICKSGGRVFNHDIDLPAAVSNGLHDYWQTASLAELPSEDLQRLRDFEFSPNTDYHGKAGAYTATYMPCNFFKIWLPLWELLKDNKLPIDPTIVEIGPGPGTTTWSAIEFYKRLAMENPTEQFKISYTAIEKESDFSNIFNEIKKNVEAELPKNLEVKIGLHLNHDAFFDMGKFNRNRIDLMLESNVLNLQEGFSQTRIDAFLTGLRGGLSDRGYAILIEPATENDYAALNNILDGINGNQKLSVYCAAKKTAVNTNGIALQREAFAAKIRRTQKAEHWFSYAIISKKKGD